MIKAVFIDIDDTLANSKMQVSMRNKDAIKNCIEKGIKIILTSGRSRKEVLEFQKQVGSSPYIISSNGASAYDIKNGIDIYKETIDNKIVNKLLNYSVKNDYRIRMDYKEKLVMNKAIYPDERDKVRTFEELEQIVENEEIVQCSLSDQNLENAKQIKEYIIKIPRVKIINESKRLNNPELKPSSNYYCDITSTLVSKGEAVEAVCNYFKIGKDEIITIGDGENDISMFNKTSNSIAMGNALQNIKEKANYITSTNDEDGVAKVLEDL